MTETNQRFLNRRLTKNEQGFTLIELLIVIVVLGILAAVVVFALGGVTGQSAQAACQADAKTVEVAVTAFDSQTGAMPTTVAALVPSYLHAWPSNATHYEVLIATGATTAIGSDSGGSTVATISAGVSGDVWVATSTAAVGNNTTPGTVTGAVRYDSEAANAGCNAVH